jgi:hypothetical protein
VRFDARLKRVADTVGACPVHGILLQCVCQYTWRGTDAEFWEIMPLADRVGRYFDHIRPPGRTCLCGEKLWCRVCYESAARQVEVPEDVFTPDELARYVELLTRMECTSPRPRSFISDEQLGLRERSRMTITPGADMKLKR